MESFLVIVKEAVRNASLAYNNQVDKIIIDEFRSPPDLPQMPPMPPMGPPDLPPMSPPDLPPMSPPVFLFEEASKETLKEIFKHFSMQPFSGKKRLWSQSKPSPIFQEISVLTPIPYFISNPMDETILSLINHNDGIDYDKLRDYVRSKLLDI
jgi:hypothetical protein